MDFQRLRVCRVLVWAGYKHLLADVSLASGCVRGCHPGMLRRQEYHLGASNLV